MKTLKSKGNIKLIQTKTGHYLVKKGNTQLLSTDDYLEALETYQDYI